MRSVLTLSIVAILATGCTGDTSRARSTPYPITPPAASAEKVPPEAEIYAAVVRHLVTGKDNFGRGRFSYKVVYVLNGPSRGAGRPRGDVFGSPARPFDAAVLAGITEELTGGLPPVHFVGEGKEALRTGKRLGEVRNDDVLIALGPIERKRGRVNVANTLWCGGKCSQWLTYSLSKRNGQWVARATVGPVVAS